jgi:DNA-binding winged helix-turn-helix (wHTH) protein/tetratricopeptide (TPR) repeat protein
MYALGPFQVDPERRLLLNRGDQVSLTSKAFEVLLYFIQNPGRVITRDELLRACWPGTAVLESNLTNHIFTIRQVLGERPHEHRYIVTVPGEGYRFVADLRKLPQEAVAGIEGTASAMPARSKALRSIAVLPFRTLGKSEWRNEYLESGLADALITRLSRIRQIVVRSSGVSQTDYAGKSPLALGRKLGVDALLVGSIQRESDHIRVTVQLLRVSDATVLWANQFDKNFADLFKVEDSVAEQTIAALRTTLSIEIEEERQISKRPTENSEAYDDYLRGRYFWNKRTEESLRTATEHFERAIRYDANYAVAYTGLADCYNLLAFLGTIATREGCALATGAALKALEIDPTLVEAHTSIAFAKFCGGAWEEARVEFDLALQGAPHYATTYHWYSEYLTALGRFDDAVAMIDRARELDPMSLTINANLGSILYFARQYDRAIKELHEALRLDQYFLLTHWYLALNYTGKKMYKEAIAELETARGLSQGSPLILATLGHVYAISHKTNQAHSLILELEQLSQRRYVSPYDFATVYAGLGKKSEAFRYLKKAYEEGSNWLAFLNVDPRMDLLRSDRVFNGLVKKTAPRS